MLAASYHVVARAEKDFARETALAQGEAARLAGTVVFRTEQRVSSGQTFSDVLFGMGLDTPAVEGILRQASSLLDLRRDFRVGRRLSVGRSAAGKLLELRYQIDTDSELLLAPVGQGYRAEVQAIPSVTEMVAVAGEIRTSLFPAVADAGEGPELALQLADIFGWDLDFYTDPRPGDTFRLVVEKKRYRGTDEVSYGRVLAAEYVNRDQPYRAVLFREPGGRPAYYAPDGKSMQKAFLRSPLKFSARVTSRFSHSRFHPILRRRRPHLGIDYGAPVGSPVQAIGNGTVTSAGWNRGGGRMVRLRHSNGYETEYLHLSRILVRPGQRVAQGQIIGRVGSTGLSTAPHLDFRIRQHGRYRNFLALQLPPAHPVAKQDWDEFAAVRDRVLPLLPEPSLLSAGTMPASATGDDSAAASGSGGK